MQFVFDFFDMRGIFASFLSKERSSEWRITLWPLAFLGSSAGLESRANEDYTERKESDADPQGGFLHIDARNHQWLRDVRWYDLMITDYATSEAS
jgi:hypothetical protein